MKTLLALLLLIPSLSRGDIENNLECLIQESREYKENELFVDSNLNTEFNLKLTIYENKDEDTVKCYHQLGTADQIRPELSGSCLKAKATTSLNGICPNLYTINSIEDEIIAYSSREELMCSKKDTYLRLNRKSGEFFISHSNLESSFYFELIGYCLEKKPIY